MDGVSGPELKEALVVQSTSPSCIDCIILAGASVDVPVNGSATASREEGIGPKFLLPLEVVVFIAGATIKSGLEEAGIAWRESSRFSDVYSQTPLNEG